MHMIFIFTANANGTSNIQRKITNFDGPERVVGIIPKFIGGENETIQKYCKMIKNGEFTLPEN